MIKTHIMGRHEEVAKRLLMGAAFFMLFGSVGRAQAGSGSNPTENQVAKEKCNQISLGLNFLGHGEIRSGGLPRQPERKHVEDHANFLMGRTRISAAYERLRKGCDSTETQPILEVKAVAQNSAIWGMRGNMSINLYEGWVRLNAKNGLFGQIGRIALAYDDERIIGPNDFATASHSHDVLRVGYEGHGHKVHGILAYNQNPSNLWTGTYYDEGAQFYKSMHVLWYHYDLPKFPLGASLLFMNIGMQSGDPNDVYNPPCTKYQQMVGGYVNYHPKHLTLEGSYYRQMGKFVDEFKQAGKIQAWMTSVNATVSPSEKYGFQVGYDYLSGDDFVPVTYGGTVGMPAHTVEKGFAPLNGSRTKFYGIMDYFYESAYTNGFTPGLQKALVGAYYNPIPKLNCKVSYYYLATATKLQDLNKTLGHAIDLQASYRFSKDIFLVAGYTQMMGTETMNRLKKGDSSKQALWGWFSLVVSPTLFKSRW